VARPSSGFQATMKKIQRCDHSCESRHFPTWVLAGNVRSCRTVSWKSGVMPRCWRAHERRSVDGACTQFPHPSGSGSGGEEGGGGGARVSHNPLCHPGPERQRGTPAQPSEPTRTPLLYSRPMTRSPRKTPEGAKWEEGRRERSYFVCGVAGPRAPRCPLKLSEPAGPNGPESHTAASPWGDLGIHTSGPPYCKADNARHVHENVNDSQSIKIPTSKNSATGPICGVTRHPGRPAPHRPPGQKGGVDSESHVTL